MAAKRRKTNLNKLATQTALYILVVGMAMIILVPIFFLVSLSFLSTREAYQYPLPILPELTTKFEITEGKRGYLISVYDKFEGAYESVMDTNDLEKISTYFRTQLNINISIEEIQEQLDRLETEDPVRFTAWSSSWS